MRKLIVLLLFISFCGGDTGETIDQVETTSTSSTTSSTTTVVQKNLSLTLSSSGLTGSVDGNQVSIRNNSGEWTGTVGNYQFYLKEEPYQVMYNWIGGLEIGNLGLDKLIQADRGSGLIGTGKYSIKISSNTWQGKIFGKKFQIEKSGSKFTGYGPKEVVFLILIYS
tara:strand:- start:67 stop:567 length:501 start_codon:yes stop_codon:yes gene_type:complete